MLLVLLALFWLWQEDITIQEHKQRELMAQYQAVQGLLDDYIDDAVTVLKVLSFRSNPNQEQKQELQPLVISAVNQLAGFEGLFITDSNGIVVAHSQPERLGHDVSQRDYFKAVRELDRIMVSDPMPSLFSTNEIVVISQPYHYNGDFAGVLAVVLPIPSILEGLKPLLKGEFSQILIADQRGLPLAGQQYSEDLLANLAGSNHMQQPQSLALKGNDGRTWLVTWGTTTWGWKLALYQDLARVRREYLRVLIGSVIFFGLLLLLVVLVYRVIIADLRRQQATLQAYSRLLEDMATRDGLTGLYNRRYFEEQIALMIKRVERSEEPLTLMFIDVNNFKDVNDQYGHLVGDKALQELALALQRAVRESDIVCRYGGDEFAILLVIGQDDANLVEKRIQEEVAAIAVDYPELKLSMAIGWAFHHLHAGTASDLIRQADDWMYLKKNCG